MFARLLRIVGSGLACAVGAVPGVFYYATEVVGPVASFALILLGGFIGLALTLPGVSTWRVIRGVASVTPLFVPLAALLDALEESEREPSPDEEPPVEAVPDGPDLRWLTATVRALAEGIRADGATDRLPILADALEEAGCDDEEILRHCRQPERVEGSSWVVEFLLRGKRSN
jgi:hypothetical protein